MDVGVVAFVLYLAVGALAGTASGLLGIGGGLLVVPCLRLIFEKEGFPAVVLMHMAAGTSLAIMLVTTSASLRSHIKRGTSIWPIYRSLVVGMVLGTMIGAFLADLLHTDVLQLFFGLFVLLISLRMLLGSETSPMGKLPGKKGMFSVALAIGGKSGLLGLGGGAITVPFLSYCNVSIREAVAVSSACSLTIAVVGTISFMITGANEANMPHLSTGYVYWPAFLGVALMSPFFAFLGSALSYRLPVKVLRRIFAVFLLLLGIRMLIF